MEENLSILRLAIALGIMSYAAVLDWRTRLAPNKVWIIMGSIAIAALLFELLYYDLQLGSDMLAEGGEIITGSGISNPALYLVFIPIGIFFFDTFWDREPVYHDGKVNFLPILLYIIGLLAMALMLYFGGLGELTLCLLSVPVMLIVFIIFYYARLIHGGADAKALMALAILFPFYPQLLDLPLINAELTIMNYAFPFAFLILMNAAIIQVAIVPISLFFKNLANKDFGFPEMFLGYRMDLHEVPKKFVWPMQKVMDGEMVLVMFPKRGGSVKEDLRALKAAGADRIWVTPKVPFIIPMLLGIVFSVVVGNLVMLFF